MQNQPVNTADNGTEPHPACQICTLYCILHSCSDAALQSRRMLSAGDFQLLCLQAFHDLKQHCMAKVALNTAGLGTMQSAYCKTAD